MTTRTNTIFGVLIGAVVGGFVGFVVGDIIANKIAPDWIDDPADGSEQDRIESEDGVNDYPPRDKERFIVKSPRRNKDRVIAPVRNYGIYSGLPVPPDLAVLAAKYRGEELPVEESKLIEEIEYEAIEEEALHGVNDPAIISFEEYLNSEMGFSKTTVHYYSEDDVLTDDQDNPVANPEKFLGPDALVSFGELSEDEDVVYIRNTEKKSEYEVVRLNKAYGPTEDAPVRRGRRSEREGDEDS